MELAGEVGFRAGATGAILGGPGRRWGSLAATVWISPRIGLVLSGGTYPIDLTQGFPGGRFLTASVRVRSTPARPVINDGTGSNTAARPKGELAMTFKAEPRPRGLVLLEVVVPGPEVRLVEVSGDFTGWMPVRLSRAGNRRWSTELPISHGTHQNIVRVNGERWTVPPGLTPISDEFGGVAGLLVIEQ
jgi:hypothetical protein